MALKRFGESPEAPEEVPTPDSLFTPFEPEKDHRREALGMKVYDSRVDTANSLEDAKALLEESVGDVQRVMPGISELVMLFGRMSHMPSASTFQAYTRKVEEVASNTEDLKAFLTMMTSLIVYLQTNGGKS